MATTCRPSMQTLAPEASAAGARERGFTLIEILVTLVLMGLISQGLVSFFMTSSKLRSIADIRLETHQAVAATMDSLARDVRLAGSCFPSNGQFVSLAGVDNGTQDTITIRLGNTSNQSCVQTALNADAAAGGNTLSLTSTQGFAVNSVGYVTNGSAGDFFTVTAVAGAVLTTDGTWSQAYPAASSSVYAMQEHIYRVNATIDSRGPVITSQRNRGTEEIFADGITALNVRYRKTDDSIVDLPGSDAEWRLVKEVLLSVSARSLTPLPGGSFHQETAAFTVKPRNLQP
jgi:prepilin-type N-terminal cleavage/methylation domain-containing protein